ncbi:MAG TPA: hypothetical protein VGL09_13610 [Methylomirabilota bacterium]|jgi:hypothetical protein
MNFKKTVVCSACGSLLACLCLVVGETIEAVHHERNERRPAVTLTMATNVPQSDHTHEQHTPFASLSPRQAVASTSAKGTDYSELKRLMSSYGMRYLETWL